MAKTSEAAIELVSRVWCYPETENLNPNIELSMIMAAKVDEMLSLLREAHSRILPKWGVEDVAWTEKYDQWLKDNGIHPDDTKEITVR